MLPAQQLEDSCSKWVKSGSAVIPIQGITSSVWQETDHHSLDETMNCWCACGSFFRLFMSKNREKHELYLNLRKAHCSSKELSLLEKALVHKQNYKLF